LKLIHSRQKVIAARTFELIVSSEAAYELKCIIHVPFWRKKMVE